MKKFSKLLAFVLAMSMMFSLAACGSSSSTNGTSSTEESTESSAPVASETADADADADADTDAEPTESGEAAGTYKLGVIGPLTGAAAIYGTAAANGAQIAVDEINAMGGIQFELSAQDDEHDAEKSVNAYNKLKDWGMQILIGTVTTTPCLAVSTETNADRIFELTPSASSADVVKDKDNVFQMCFTDPNQGIASAQYIAENELGESIAIIYNNSDAYSTGIYQKFVAEAEELGLNIVSTTTFTDDTATDFSVQLNAAKDAGADLLFLPIYYQPASLILAQAAGMNYAPKIFGVDGMDGILTMEGFDASLAEGVMLLTPFSADAEDDLTVSFVTKYEEQYGETPNQFAADGYDCVYTIYYALLEAGVDSSASNEEICDALIGVFTSDSFSVDGVTGTGMTWSTEGEVSKAPKGMIIENGVYVGMD